MFSWFKRLAFLFCLFVSALLPAQPRLIVTPSNPCVQDIVHLKGEGFLPHEQIKIIANLRDEKGRAWESSATFETDESGRVDLWEQAPIQGTYSGIDPMGLFWSMYVQDPINQGLFTHASLDPVVSLFRVEGNDGRSCCETEITRTVTRHKITKTPINENGIIGNLYFPDGEGPFPGIIVLGGSEGGYPADSFVAQFADQGFVALGLPYFKVPSLPEHLVNIPLEYFGKAVQWMKSRKDIDTTNLAIAGLSMGGTTALLVASYYPEIKSVISICGRGVHFQSIYFEGFEAKPQPIFTYQGKPLPFLPVKEPALDAENEKTAYFLRIFLEALFDAKPDLLDRASTKVEKIQGPVLLLSALDDRLAGSAILSGLSYDRLVRHNFSHPFDLIVYNGAGHFLFSLPYTPSTTMLSSRPLFPLKVSYDLGGLPSCMASAQANVWQRIFQFLDEQKTH